jgi:hypothetical protein
MYDDMPDLEFIKMPPLWPNWPWLPIKRYRMGQATGGPECAALCSTNLENNVLYLVHANMWDKSGLAAAWDSRETVTPQQIVDDGWVVD